MQWTPEAEAAIGKVPFFVRRRVRKAVEEFAAEHGRERITLATVQATRKRFLGSMEKEVKGFALDCCFGDGGCPNPVQAGAGLAGRIRTRLEQADLKSFLRSRVRGELRFHHELRVTLADCPNACSQPQIKDIGIIGACRPRVGERECTACGACVQACRERAIALPDEGPPVIDFQACVACGKCVGACPTGTLLVGERGYRVLVGGKLGRHPRLARELPGIHDADAVMEIIDRCLRWYKEHCHHGERFSQLLATCPVAPDLPGL